MTQRNGERKKERKIEKGKREREMETKKVKRFHKSYSR